jgi:hypothetical protein
MQVSQKRIADVKKQIVDQYDVKYTAIAYMPFQTHFGDGENGYLNTVANQLDAMTAAQELNIPCVNSYTGFDPGNYLDFFFEPSDKTLKNWCDFNQSDYTKIQHINDLKHREISRTKINLQGYNRKFLTAIEGGEPLVFANRDVAANWETFFLVKMENGECIIKAETNLLFSADVDQQGKLSASKNIAGEWETFQLSELKDSTFAFKAANGKFLSVDTMSLQVFARSADVGKTEKFRITEK